MVWRTVRSALKKKKWNEAHPSLDVLQQRLSARKKDASIDAELRAQFKKLPKHLRVQITDAAAKQKSHRYDLLDHNEVYDQTGKYRARIERLGKKCLESYLKNAKLTDSETALLRRAVKKTAKFFWMQWWYSNKHEYFRKQALKLEELLAGIKDGDKTKAASAYGHIIQSCDISLQCKLYDNIQRIFKREASVGALSRAIEVVQTKAMQSHRIQKLIA